MVRGRVILVALMVVVPTLVPTVEAQLSIVPGSPIVPGNTNKYADTQTVEFVEDRLVMQGDIVVGHSGDQNGQMRGFGLGGSLELWRSGIVPFVISPDLSPISIARVREAILQWNQHTRIQLVEKPADQATELVATLDGPIVGESDFVVFKQGTGCASWVGRQGGEQPVWVSAECGVGSIMHEIGHALGLLHEHSRPDRDSYIALDLEQVEINKQLNFDIVGQGTQSIGDYDLESIMHYGSHYFSATGLPTIKALAAGAHLQLGQREELSPGDIAAINQLYATAVGLSVSSEFDTERNVTRVQVDVAVNADMGANQVAVVFDSASSLVNFSSAAGWDCRYQNTRTTCALASLDAHELSTIVITLAGQQVMNNTNTGVISRTYDGNTVNNGMSLSTELAASPTQLPINDGNYSTPAIASALSGSADSGSGSTSPWAVVLLMFFTFRCVNVNSRLSKIAP